MVVELAPELLEILACPNCHGPLAVDHERDEGRSVEPAVWMRHRCGGPGAGTAAGWLPQRRSA